MIKHKAIRNAYPTVVTINDNSAFDKDGNTVILDDALVQIEVDKLQAEYDAQDYARKRKAEYPSLNDFAEAYTEKEIGSDSTKWDTYVINYNKVRTENPK